MPCIRNYNKNILSINIRFYLFLNRNKIKKKGLMIN